LNYFWVLHPQIVLDRHTIFAWKPPFVHVKGTTKKADAFGLFVYPNWFSLGGMRIANSVKSKAERHVSMGQHDYSAAAHFWKTASSSRVHGKRGVFGGCGGMRGGPFRSAKQPIQNLESNICWKERWLPSGAPAWLRRPLQLSRMTQHRKRWAYAYSIGRSFVESLQEILEFHRKRPIQIFLSTISISVFFSRERAGFPKDNGPTFTPLSL
jgi:hypothetical protein